MSVRPARLCVHPAATAAGSLPAAAAATALPAARAAAFGRAAVAPVTPRRGDVPEIGD